MRRFVAAVSLLAASASIVSAKLLPGDAKRGSELIRSQNCINCHRFGGEGGSTAPDLGKARGRNYTPSSMASTMWNHAPEMWASMDKQGTARPVLNEMQAADLFAYFHSIRYFDRPGDAARGKRAFVANHCAECHDRSKPVSGGGPPIASWSSLTSPIYFAQRMWNHAPQMEAAMAAKKLKWARLTAADLTDILVYVQSFPESRSREKEFSLTSSDKGESLFKAKCYNCHQGKLSFENRPIAATVTDFAVAMWNHSPNMSMTARRNDQVRPTLEPDEMQELVSFLWNKQIFGETGNAAKGGRVFEKKNCSTCHNEKGGGGPDLKQWLAKRSDPMRPITMVSVLWQHGPAMLEGMKAKQLPWPVFSQSEMLDLIAYLNSLNPPATTRSE